MPSTIAGRVIDNTRRPIGGVSISRRGKVIAESANDGFFSINLAKAESRVAVTFAAEGYVSNTRVFDSRAAVLGNVVVIWPRAYRVTFDPSRQLDIGLGSSGIRVPADVLEGLGGKKVSGNVELHFTWFDVTDPFQRAAAPGDFSGRLADGSVRRLSSYGIFDFDLRDLRGGSLSVRRGANVELSIAVPPSLADHAPGQVGSFSFDASSGIWVHDGTFDYVPGAQTFNGKVRSIGPRCLDPVLDTVCVRVRVINIYTSSVGMPNMLVTVQGGQYAFSATSDANGFTCLVVERNAPFSVTAQGGSGGNFWGTPHPVNFTSPSSGAGDCANPGSCPVIGTVPVDFVVGTGHRAGDFG